MNDKKAIKTLNKIVDALRIFFSDRGFTKAVVGLSGGIDSAVTTYIACKALGKENVYGVLLSCDPNTSKESVQLANQLANNLQVWHKELLITEPFTKMMQQMWSMVNAAPSITVEENMQSRIRAVMLMAVANDKNALLLSSGNQTEDELGYFTLYGDGCGAVAPLGNLAKHEVYDLARVINLDSELIPQGIIGRKPTAELSKDQFDPFNYDVDSRIVERLVQFEDKYSILSGVPIYEIADQCNTTWERVLELSNLRKKNRFKREQSAKPLEY
jgi:NAD+ synthase (glutamine-hydrolysing)